MKYLVLIFSVFSILSCSNNTLTSTESNGNSPSGSADNIIADPPKEFNPVGTWANVLEVEGEYDKDNYAIAMLKALRINLGIKSNGKLIMNTTMGTTSMDNEYFWQYSNGKLLFNTEPEFANGSSVLIKINEDKFELENKELPKNIKQYFIRQ